jgi:hypothetical protein
MTGIGPGAGESAEVTAAGPGREIGRRAAQELARRELAKLASEPLWYRILADIGRAFGTASGAIPAGWFGLIALGVLAAALIAVILIWARPKASKRLRTSAVLGGQTRTAQQYRLAARRLAAAGAYSGAIIEGVRGIAAELDERGILAPRPGRTANELAIEAGKELPALAADLRAVTRLFDDVRYGDREGTQAGYELVTRLDARAMTAQVTVTDQDKRQAGQLEVPR